MTENHNPYSIPDAGQGPQPEAEPQFGPQPEPQPSFTRDGSPEPGPQQHQAAADKFFNSIRRSGFFRSEERWVGGVAAGLARKFDLDPLLIRGLLAASFLFAGAGVVLYGVAWALLPEEHDGRIHLQETIRGNFDGALIGAGIAVILGFSLGTGFGGRITGILWLAIVAGVVTVVVITTDKPRTTRQQPPLATQRQSSTPSAASAGAQQAHAPSATPDTSGRGYAPPTKSTHRVPPQHPQSPRPPKVRGPGGSIIGAVLGIWALVVAGLLIADRAERLSVPVSILSVSVLIGLCGIGAIIAGMRGRSAGTLSIIAIIALIVVVPTVAWSGTGLKISEANHGGIGEAVFVPTSVAEAEKGYAVLVGEWEVDLTGLPPSDELVEIPISLAAGELAVRMPAESAWSAQVSLAAGEIRLRAPENATTRSGVLIGNHNLSSQTVAEGATADYLLTIRGGAGQITIIEEQP